MSAPFQELHLTAPEMLELERAMELLAARRLGTPEYARTMRLLNLIRGATTLVVVFAGARP